MVIERLAPMPRDQRGAVLRCRDVGPSSAGGRGSSHGRAPTAKRRSLMIPTARRLAAEDGFSLLEVMVGGLVLAVALVGVAVLYGWGQANVIAQGGNRVALYLAQQEIERLTSSGFDNSLPMGTTSTTMAAGFGGSQTFTRQTCIYFVKDNDPNDPANDPPTCTSCALGPDCSQKAKGIRVAVTGPMRQEPAPVVLKTVLTKP